MIGPALVSCLMVTKLRTERFPFVQQSIAAYARQTYPHRELVILMDEAEAEAIRALEGFVLSLGRPDIRLIPPQGPATLGALRNRSVAASQGDVLCQWDDDDFHHPERVARQVAAMTLSGREACFLQDVFQLVADERALFWTNWRHAPVPAHPGTLTCRRSAMPPYPEDGPRARRDEDREVLERLQAAGQVEILSGMPELFIYRMHGTNISPQSHLRMLVDSLSVSAAFLRRREAQLRQELAVFDFGPGEVVVTGSNGAAFSLSAPHDR